MTRLEVKQLADEICTHSFCLMSVDRYDMESLFANKKCIDGFRVECPYDHYGKEMQAGIDRLTDENGFRLAGMIIYIDTAEEDNVMENMEKIRSVFDYIGIQELSKKTSLVAGIGKSKHVPSGHFCLKVLAGYE